MGQQSYPSHSPRRNGRHRGSNGPIVMVGIIPIHLVEDMELPMTSQVVVMVVLQMVLKEPVQNSKDDRYDQNNEQHDQFEQSMIAMTDLLIKFLHCQQELQNDTVHVLQVIHQTQPDHFPVFDGKPDLFLTGF